MNGDKIFLDTNIVIYLLGGDATLANFLFEKQLFISFITELEVLSLGNYKQGEKKKIEEFINQCTIVDINDTIKSTVKIIRSKKKLKLPDCIIAASAAFVNIPLITADKNFKDITTLDIIIYQK